MTSVRTFEGRVEDGKIRRRGNVALSDETRVYAVGT